jgi:CHAT domain-containing protein
MTSINQAQEPSTKKRRCTKPADLVKSRKMKLLLCLALACFTGLFCYKVAFSNARGAKSHVQVGALSEDPRLSNNASALLEEANRLAWLANWQQAGPLYARAEQLFEERGDNRNRIYAQVGGLRAQYQTLSPEAVSKSLAQILENPVVKGDQDLRLWCLAAKGYTDLDINVPSSKRAWTEAESLADRLGAKRWKVRAQGELGIIAFLEGNVRGAGHLVGEALVSSIAMGDVGGEIRALMKLGDGFGEVNRDAEALAFYDHAMKLARETSDAGFPFTAYEGKARILTREGKVTEAQSYLTEALAVAENSAMRFDKMQILVLLGEANIKTGNRERAIENLREASTLGGMYGWFYIVCQAMLDLTAIYRSSGDLRSAEASAASAVDASRHLGSTFYLPRDLTLLADLKELRGKSGEAEKLYEQAEDVIDEILSSSAGPYWSNSIADAMSVTYVHHFELCTRRGQLDRAVNVLERIRGRTTAAILENEMSISGRDSEETRVLDRTVSQLQGQLVRSADTAERARLTDQVFQYERRLEWAGPVPGSKHGWFEKPVSIVQLQEILRPDELVLEYVLDDPLAYCVWISRDAAGSVALPEGRKRIEDLAGRYLDTIRARHEATEIGKELSRILLTPIPSAASSPRLIVVADGLLHRLPFDSLTDSNGGALIESKIVSYIPASTVLYTLRNRKSNIMNRRPFLGLGDVAYQDQGKVSAQLPKANSIRERLARDVSDIFGMPLYDLPKTREEVVEISKVFDKIKKGSVLLLGPNATETAFKSQPLSEFQIIHLAVHGFADTQFPERSGLVLGVDKTAHDDGLLQMREILRLRFSADLVTLSACNTDVGKISGEEGVTNLPEAFLLTGAKSVVASLWSADDSYTLFLMQSFYSYIASGEDPALALRQAKLDLLAKYGKEKPPYYWAAFVLIGDGASPLIFSSQ